MDGGLPKREDAGPGRVNVRWSCAAVVLAAIAVAPGLAAQSKAAEPVWVQGGPYRLKASVFQSAPIGRHPVLVVVLHGDAPFTKPDYQDTFAARVAGAGQDVVAIGLLRPGYTDPAGNTSDGERGQTTGDSYNARNTDAIAAAIVELKGRYQARKVLVAGHSGGAAITGNILGRHPDLIDGALLVSCPCDVERWRAHMFEVTKFAGFQGRIETLSPTDLISGISAVARIAMVIGSQDSVAPPSLTEAFRAAAVKAGKRVQVVTLVGKGHEILLEPAVLAELMAMLRALEDH